MATPPESRAPFRDNDGYYHMPDGRKLISVTNAIGDGVPAVPAAGCSVDGCTRRLKCKGFCLMHYTRLRRHGDTSVSLINRDHPDVCSVTGCARPYACGGFCSMHWQRYRLHGSTAPVDPVNVRYPATAQCSVEGCERRPVAKWLCGMHRERLNDRGDVGGPEPLKKPNGSGYERLDGYTEIRCAIGHPLSRRGRALLHRVVLWSKIGDGPHECHWCACVVNWSHGLLGDALVVDHLDFDRTNNDSDNLVPSCHACNSKRHLCPVCNPRQHS